MGEAMDNLISQISNDLASYIITMIEALDMPIQEAKKTTNAALMKQMLKVAETEEEGVYDLIVMKPLLIGVVIALNSRMKELQEEAKDLPSPLSEQLSKQAADYNAICCSLDKIIKSLDNSGGN